MCVEDLVLDVPGLARRDDAGGRRITAPAGPGTEGGFDDVDESLPSRRRSSSTCAASTGSCACAGASCASPGSELRGRQLVTGVAAIDVHKDMVKVAVRVPGERRGTRKTDLLEFRTFYGVLEEILKTSPEEDGIPLADCTATSISGRSGRLTQHAPEKG